MTTAGHSGPNAEQAQRWNGESGRRWVTHRKRHQAEHQNLVPRLFEAAAIAPGERVLDVGCGCGATTIAAARAALDLARPGGRAVGVDLSAPMLDRLSAVRYLFYGGGHVELHRHLGRTGQHKYAR